MSNYVIFYEVRQHDKKLVRKLGSEGLLPLDGRLSVARALHKAREQRQRLRNVAPAIIACKLHHRHTRPEIIFDLTQPPHEETNWSPKLQSAIQAGVID